MVSVPLWPAHSQTPAHWAQEQGLVGPQRRREIVGAERETEKVHRLD